MYLHVEEAGPCVGAADGEGVLVGAILHQQVSSALLHKKNPVQFKSAMWGMYREYVQQTGRRQPQDASNTWSASRYMVWPKMGRRLRRNPLESPARRSCSSRCTATCACKSFAVLICNQLAR